MPADFVHGARSRGCADLSVRAAFAAIMGLMIFGFGDSTLDKARRPSFMFAVKDAPSAKNELAKDAKFLTPHPSQKWIPKKASGMARLYGRPRFQLGIRIPTRARWPLLNFITPYLERHSPPLLGGEMVVVERLPQGGIGFARDWLSRDYLLRIWPRMA